MKILRFAATIIVVFSIVSLSSCGTISDLIFKGMNNLPKGDFIAAYDSPTELYTLNVYLCGGGATVDFSIRGELVNNENKSEKNIYWSYHEQEAAVEWVDEQTVSINGKTLNVLTDVYDFRK